MDKEPTYPEDQWAKLSPEDREFMRQVKETFPNVKYEGETGPEGVKVFPNTEWERRGYWSNETTKT